MADAVILDTSAILTLTGNEPGADEVQTYLAEAIAGRIRLHGSFASLTEVEYIMFRSEAAHAAAKVPCLRLVKPVYLVGKGFPRLVLRSPSEGGGSFPCRLSAVLSAVSPVKAEGPATAEGQHAKTLPR